MFFDWLELNSILRNCSRCIQCVSKGVIISLWYFMGHILAILFSSRKQTKEEEDQAAIIMRETETFSVTKCREWFLSYAESSSHLPNGKIMTPVGIQKWAEDLDKDLEDIVFLVLAWKMQAKQMGLFSEEEWISGMKEFQIENNKKLLEKWEDLRKLLDDPEIFRNVYRFSYDFSRDKELRHLEAETSKGLIKLFLGEKWELCEAFLEFMDAQSIRFLNKDQYNNILEFYLHVKSDMSDYDLEGAWPVLMDDFVLSLRPAIGNENAKDHM